MILNFPKNIHEHCYFEDWEVILGWKRNMFERFPNMDNSVKTETFERVS